MQNSELQEGPGRQAEALLSKTPERKASRTEWVRRMTARFIHGWMGFRKGKLELCRGKALYTNGSGCFTKGLAEERGRDRTQKEQLTLLGWVCHPFS